MRRRIICSNCCARTAGTNSLCIHRPSALSTDYQPPSDFKLDLEYDQLLAKLRAQNQVKPESFAVRHTMGGAPSKAPTPGGRSSHGMPDGKTHPVPVPAQLQIPSKGSQSVAGGTATSEEITPRPITPTFGCAKETHPHSPYVCGFGVCGRDASWWCVVGRGLVGGGVRTSILFECCA